MPEPFLCRGFRARGLGLAEIVWSDCGEQPETALTSRRQFQLDPTPAGVVEGEGCFADSEQRAAAWEAHYGELSGMSGIPGNRCWGLVALRGPTALSETGRRSAAFTTSVGRTPSGPRATRSRSSTWPAGETSNLASSPRWNRSQPKPRPGSAPSSRSPPTRRRPASMSGSARRCRDRLGVDASHVVPGQLPQSLNRRPVTEGAMSSPEVVALDPAREAAALSGELP